MERSTDDARVTEDSTSEETVAGSELAADGGPDPDGESGLATDQDAPDAEAAPRVPSGPEAGTESGFDVPAGEGASAPAGGGLVDLTTDEGPDHQAGDLSAPTGAEEAVAEPDGPSETADVVVSEPAPDAAADAEAGAAAEVGGFDAAAIQDAAPFPDAEIDEPTPAEEPAAVEDGLAPAADAVAEPEMDLPIEEETPIEDEMADAAVESADVEPAETVASEPEPAARADAEAAAAATPAPQEVAAEPAEEAPARGRDPFRGPGDWYVVHTYAGYENKVKANLASRINSMQMQDKIFDVHIPMEDVMEIKGGKKQVVQKKVFPGYLLVKMIYDNDSWYVVRNTPGVTGFVSSGTGTKPTPLSRREVEKILTVKEEETQKAPRFRLEFEEGDMVRIIAGPFADFNGKISEINVDQSKLKVLVSIFDRETPVELGFDQVAKV